MKKLILTLGVVLLLLGLVLTGCSSGVDGNKNIPTPPPLPNEQQGEESGNNQQTSLPQPPALPEE